MVQELTLQSVYLKVRKLQKKVRILKKRNPEIVLLKNKVSRLEKRLNKLTSNEDLDELISITSNANTVEIKIEPGLEIKPNCSDFLEVLDANILVPADTEDKIDALDLESPINPNISCFDDLIKIGQYGFENNDEKATEPEKMPNAFQNDFKNEFLNDHSEGNETENTSFGFGSICNENFEEDCKLDDLSPSLKEGGPQIQLKNMSVIIPTLTQSEIQKYMAKTINEFKENQNAENLENEKIEKTYICQICQKTFISPILFQRHHHLTHTPKTPKTPKSPKNDSNFIESPTTSKVKDSLKRKSSCFSCKICHKQFSAPNILKRHSKVHFDSDSESIEEIDVEMDSSNNKEETPISCDLCNIYFKNQHYMNLHINLIHPDMKKMYTCKICNKIFKSESTLRRHSAIHSADQRPFNCSKCQKNFKRKDLLADHNRSVHLGIREFECKTCSKFFLRKSSLENHQLVHNH